MDHARPEQTRRGFRNVEHRRFNTNLALASVNNQWDFAAKLLLHMRNISWGNSIGQVCTRGRQRKSAYADDRLHERMAGPTDPNGPSSCSQDVRDVFCSG